MALRGGEKVIVPTAASFLLRGLAAGAFFWVLDSFVDSEIMHEGTFSNQLFSPSPVEIWMRLMVLSIFVGFSFYTHSIIKKTFLAEEKERVNDRRFRKLVESGLGMICSHDLSGNFLLVNPAAAQILGYDKAALTKMNLKELVPPRYREEVDVYLSEIRDKKEMKGISRMVTKGGDERLISFQNVLLEEPCEEPYVLGHGQDMTERIKAEKAMDEFVSIASHEIRTPLTSIRGALGLLAGGGLEGNHSQQQRMLSIATKNTERLVRLVNDILDIERIKSGKLVLHGEVIRAEELMQTALEIMQPQADKGGVLLRMKASQCTFWGDPDRMVQIITNLLSNSIKFSPDGGTVWLMADQGDKEILFTVADEGCGIPAEEAKAVFEHFRQVDRTDSRDRSGAGLGLAICQGIVRQHGGRIWLESKPKKGTTFFFAIPSHLFPPPHNHHK